MGNSPEGMFVQIIIEGILNKCQEHTGVAVNTYQK